MKVNQRYHCFFFIHNIIKINLSIFWNFFFTRRCFSTNFNISRKLCGRYLWAHQQRTQNLLEVFCRNTTSNMHQFPPDFTQLMGSLKDWIFFDDIATEFGVVTYTWDSLSVVVYYYIEASSQPSGGHYRRAGLRQQHQLRDIAAVWWQYWESTTSASF